MLITPKQDWALSAEAVALVRGGARSWNVRTEAGRRPTICRSCGETIPGKQIRLFFKHLNWEQKRYDFIGTLHKSELDCIPGQVVNLQQQQIEELEASGIDLQESKEEL